MGENDSIGKGSSRSMDRAVKITKRAAYIEGLVLAGIIFCASGVLPEAFDIDAFRHYLKPGVSITL